MNQATGELASERAAERSAIADEESGFSELAGESALEDDFGSGDDGEESDEEFNDESSMTGASELEEEKEYAEKGESSACGLSPRLVVRRACTTLQAGFSLADNGVPMPELRRVDTVSSFERAVGRSRATANQVLSPPILSHSVSGLLPEVASAFAAVSDKGEAAAEKGSAMGEESRSSSLNTLAPLAVHRVDTMDHLLDPSPPAKDGDARPAKRHKAAPVS